MDRRTVQSQFNDCQINVHVTLEHWNGSEVGYGSAVAVDPVAGAADRPFCAEASAARGEPLAATASRIDHWILVEYRRLWNRDLLAGSGLSDEVKAHLRAQLDALPRSRLLFVRRPDRRAHDGIAVFFGRSGERGGRFHGVELEDYEDLRTLDLAGTLAGDQSVASLHERPLLVVCTHGKRDRCCARYGRPLYDALRAREDVRDCVWQSTHVGGDRFAGNLVCLPEGVYYGRVGAGDVSGLVEEYRAGRIALERYRGRAAYGFAVQAAEIRVREETGLRELHDLALARVAPAGDHAWEVRFRERATGATHDVEVALEHDPEPALLTCSAVAPARPRRYVARAARAA